MPVLNAASALEIERLLALFPFDRMKEKWPDVKGKKYDRSLAIATQRDRQKIVEFLDENLSCCKQHVYVFSPPQPLNQLPNFNITSAEKLKADGQRELYLTKVKFDVVLRDPLEEASIEFLWPFRVEVMRDRLIVRFVVLEKNLSSYFGGRPSSTIRRDIEEDSILQEVKDWFNGDLPPTDIHKGIKTLWKKDFMDATRTRYRKPRSTASEIMDEAKGIKEHDHALYLVLLQSHLSNIFFQRKADRRCDVSVFWAEPADGEIDFSRYTEKRGHTDFVIDEVLRHN
jgi:hypothetical protein